VFSEFNSRKDHQTTILRQNSFASKLMTKYTKVVGSEYLRLILHDNVQSLYDQVDLLLDPDPKNLKDDKDSSIIEKQLKKICQKIFDDIVDKVDKMPRELKAICYYINEAGKSLNMKTEEIYQLISGFKINLFKALLY
jgi:hypothetical protein